MSKIYFCGEVVADLLEQEEGSGNLKFLLGGSHFNGAMGAARAVRREDLADQIQVGFVGTISQDFFGQRHIHALEENKVSLEGVTRVNRNTTLAIVSIRPGRENDFSFYADETAAQKTSPEELPAHLGEENEKKILWFGSISTVMDPARKTWLSFAQSHKKDAVICYDLNARPSIAKDPERYREILLEWARKAHVMKASDADIAWAYPKMSMKDIATLWMDAGAALIVFTKGMHGSEAYTRKAFATASTLDLVAANTVGAGDNFNAGLALALSKKNCFTQESLEALTQKNLEEILKIANETAAYHLVSIGAKPRSAA